MGLHNNAMQFQMSVRIFLAWEKEMEEAIPLQGIISITKLSIIAIVSVQVNSTAVTTTSLHNYSPGRYECIPVSMASVDEEE